jgi:hypothetical protein
MARNAGNKTNGKAITAAERQAKALEMRKGGATFAVIAARLGFKGPQGAHETVSKAIALIPREAADELRAMEVERLDAMLAGLYARACKGDEAAIDRVLRIMERRARFLGLDLPPAEPTKPVNGLREMNAEADAYVDPDEPPAA